MKILNLYCGIGGNRKLWEDVEVTAVEIDKQIAAIYQDFFPDDKVVVGDAHDYILRDYKLYDFIWSSPPCPSHSKLRFLNDIKIYPDMKLYEEIIFLKHFAKKQRWVVENVRPYYQPLISGIEVGRHLFWSDFPIKGNKNRIENNPIKNWTYKDYENYYGFDLSGYAIKAFDKRKMLRNCVEPGIGNYILNAAREQYPKADLELFADISNK